MLPAGPLSGLGRDMGPPIPTGRLGLLTFQGLHVDLEGLGLGSGDPRYGNRKDAVLWSGLPLVGVQVFGQGYLAAEGTDSVLPVEIVLLLCCPPGDFSIFR